MHVIGRTDYGTLEAHAQFYTYACSLGDVNFPEYRNTGVRDIGEQVKPHESTELCVVFSQGHG